MKKIFYSQLNWNKNYLISPMNWKKLIYHEFEWKKLKCEDEKWEVCFYCKLKMPRKTFFIFDLFEFDLNWNIINSDILLMNKWEISKKEINLEEEFLFFTTKQFDEEILNLLKNKINFDNSKLIIKRLIWIERWKKMLKHYFEDNFVF